MAAKKTTTEAAAAAATDAAGQILTGVREATEKMFGYTDKATAISLKAIKTVAGYAPESLRPQAVPGLPVDEARQLVEAGFDLYQGIAARQRQFVIDLFESVSPA